MVKLGDKVIQNETYAYDANHNLIKQNNVNHTFDALNRLTSGYAYDKAGNITSGNGLTMTYDKDSRLQSVNKVATTSDADGNLTAYTVAGKAHKATYNSQNQLTAYDGTTYTYDANGNRLTAGAQTYITDATGQVLADKDNQYVYGAQGLMGYYDKTGKFVTVTSDNRGDILNLLDEAGTVRGTMSYSDYGAVTKTTGTVDTPFRYAGRLGVITDSNGLVYLKTRYYNPQLMRFMNRDTVAGSVTDSQSLNRFSYVEGNPLTYVDLNGQARTWLHNYGEQLFTYTELGLAGLGMIPVLSDATNLIMMGVDLAVGDYSGVALDAIGLVPYANDVSNSAKIARLSAKLDKTASTAEKVVKAQKYEVAVRPKYEIAVERTTKAKPKTDFYVKPNGDAIPATGYRYINSKYEDITRESMTVPGSKNGNYVAFERFDSSSEVRNAYQISPNWSDAGVRGEFDTLQVIDNIHVPTTLGNTTDVLEPITSAYPEFGSGGAQQLMTNNEIKLRSVERLKP